MKKFHLICKIILIYILYINNAVTTNIHNTNTHNQCTKNTSVFQSEKNTSLIYNQSGKLICKLITKSMQYLKNIKTIHCIRPTAILFNHNNIPIWYINANQAKVTTDKIMHLYGNVQISNLLKNSYIQHITTNIAILNLITYDIFSSDTITIYGMRFKTTAAQMHGNLHTKTTQLSKTVHTIYTTKNSQ